MQLGEDWEPGHLLYLLYLLYISSGNYRNPKARKIKLSMVLAMAMVFGLCFWPLAMTMAMAMAMATLPGVSGDVELCVLA